MKNIEQRLKAMETMIAEIHEFIITVRAAAAPDEAEYWRAIDALVQGNGKPLEEFQRRGGIIPRSTPIATGSHAERPDSPSTARNRHRLGEFTANLPPAAPARSCSRIKSNGASSVRPNH